MLRHVFLDFGGTLAKETRGRHEIYAEAARGAGLSVAPERMRELMSAAHDSLPARIGLAWRYDDAWFRIYMERIFCDELGLARAALPALARELFETFSDPHTFRLYPGTMELLEALERARLHVAILSNWSTALPRLVERLGLSVYVPTVVASALEGVEKPDLAFFAHALARTGARPPTALHAGDRLEQDCRGARAAGIAAILVQHAESPPPPAAALEFPIASSLFELRDLILERLA
jgi:putative hydrolase of the HAD superfamily